VRERVAAQARYRCGYCQTQQAIIGAPLHIEHIVPEAAGGSSEEHNLWLACSLCNNYKGTQTHAPDPMSGETVSLFNPRTQVWHDHFTWRADGTEIAGLTQLGVQR
jgi:5-methylcytosine-specific restriction endonuclease McrA